MNRKCFESRSGTIRTPHKIDDQNSIRLWLFSLQRVHSVQRTVIPRSVQFSFLFILFELFKIQIDFFAVVASFFFLISLSFFNLKFCIWMNEIPIVKWNVAIYLTLDEWNSFEYFYLCLVWVTERFEVRVDDFFCPLFFSPWTNIVKTVFFFHNARQTPSDGKFMFENWKFNNFFIFFLLFFYKRYFWMVESIQINSYFYHFWLINVNIILSYDIWAIWSSMYLICRSVQRDKIIPKNSYFSIRF